MYIKQVTICGLKSYRSRTTIGPFDPQINIVVGKNGSGKSNLLTAIQFVFSDEYAHLRDRHLEELIYNKQSRDNSTYVEIIIDNSDRRLNINNSEVVIRRTTTKKSDKYMINQKIVKRDDLMSLLDASGISILPKYFIVKQAEIRHVATSSDAQRRKILLEAVGSKKFSQRIAEFQSLGVEIIEKTNQIEDAFVTIARRIASLESERQHFKEYQILDNKKRTIELVKYGRKLEEVEEKLAKMKEDRDKLFMEQLEGDKPIKVIQQQYDKAKLRLKATKNMLQMAQERRDQIQGEQNLKMKKKDIIKVNLERLERDGAEVDGERQALKEELSRILLEIDDNIKLIEKRKQKLAKIGKKEVELKEMYFLRGNERDELYMKHQKTDQFTDKQARDDWLKMNIQKLEKENEDCKESMPKLKKEREELDKEASELEEALQDEKLEMQEFKKMIKMREDEIRKQSKLYEDFQIKMHRILKEQHKSEKTLALIEADFLKENHRLSTISRKSILICNESINKVLESFQNDPAMKKEAEMYHGMVMDCVDCPTELYTALEVAADHQLFHHIVDTDEFATRIIEELNSQKLPGEYNFIPINQVRQKVRNYSDNDKNRLLLSKLQYDEVYKIIMERLFGNVILCANTQMAEEISATKGFKCVTLEGEVYYGKGAIVGGDVPNNKSKIKIYKSIVEMRQKMDKIKQELDEYHRKHEECNRDIVVCNNKKDKFERKATKDSNIINEVKSKIDHLEEKLQQVKTLIAKNEESQKEVELVQVKNEDKIQRLMAALVIDFEDEFSKLDQEKVLELSVNLRMLEEQIRNVILKKLEITEKIHKLETLLKDNLCSKKTELEQKLSKIHEETQSNELVTLREELVRIENEENRHANDKHCDVQEGLIKELLQRCGANEARVKEYEDELRAAERSIFKYKQAVCIAKTNYQYLLDEQKAAYEKLNKVPVPNLEKYSEFKDLQVLSHKELTNEIHKINKELRKYPRYDLEAVNEYTLLNGMFENKTSHFKELMNDRDEIEDLVNYFQDVSAKSVLTTLKNINEHFNDIFRRFITGARAEIVMTTAREAIRLDRITSDELDRFMGIGVIVTLPGKKRSMAVNHLSGGQQTLVALALIFAIQRQCPPAFYLFDEVDAALDDNHRRIIAKVIREMSENAQFIITTFRPEILEHADQFFGVHYSALRSHVAPISRRNALNFVEK